MTLILRKSRLRNNPASTNSIRLHIASTNQRENVYSAGTTGVFTSAQMSSTYLVLIYLNKNLLIDDLH